MTNPNRAMEQVFTCMQMILVYMPLLERFPVSTQLLQIFTICKQHGL